MIRIKENHDFCFPLQNLKKQKKILKLHTRIMKTMKSNLPCLNNENHAIIRISFQKHENHENLIIPRKNHENREIHWIPLMSYENHKKILSPFRNHGNHEIPRIPRQNYENLENSIIFCQNQEKHFFFLEFHARITKIIKK